MNRPENLSLRDKIEWIIKELRKLRGNVDNTSDLNNKQDKLQNVTGNTGVGKTDASATEKLDVNGNVKANAFIKSGGTSTQFLMADGSVDNNSRTFNWENAIAVGFSSGAVPTNSGSHYPYIYHNAGGYIALATQPYVINNYAPKNNPVFNNKITIRDNAIEEIATNGLSGIAINYAGYNGGFTHYRNLDIYDGKGGHIAQFNGQNKELNLFGNVKATQIKDQYGTLRSQRVITITGNITLSQIHNGAILHITNTCNITIPTGLGADFACDCYVKGAFIATFVNGGVTLNSPSGLRLKTDKMCTLYSNSANSLNLLGELATS